jgi:hypothetical protein
MVDEAKYQAFPRKQAEKMGLRIMRALTPEEAAARVFGRFCLVSPDRPSRRSLRMRRCSGYHRD